MQVKRPGMDLNRVAAVTRNLRITMKVAVAFWILIAARLLMGSVPTPTISSVTPNPVPSGTVNITITGTGFESGVLLYQTYTGESRIQYSPNTWSSTSLTVNGIWQPATETVTFEVKNPGGSYSNVLTIPVPTEWSNGAIWQQFDGAAFSSYAVYFPVYSASFTGTTLNLPAGAHTLVVTGLVPATGYNVISGSGKVSISPGGANQSDAGGVLILQL